jgi:hypothetical protein
MRGHNTPLQSTTPSLPRTSSAPSPSSPEPPPDVVSFPGTAGSLFRRSYESDLMCPLLPEPPPPPLLPSPPPPPPPSGLLDFLDNASGDKASELASHWDTCGWPSAQGDFTIDAQGTVLTPQLMPTGPLNIPLGPCNGTVCGLWDPHIARRSSRRIVCAFNCRHSPWEKEKEKGRMYEPMLVTDGSPCAIQLWITLCLMTRALSVTFSVTFSRVSHLLPSRRPILSAADNPSRR